MEVGNDNCSKIGDAIQRELGDIDPIFISIETVVDRDDVWKNRGLANQSLGYIMIGLAI